VTSAKEAEARAAAGEDAILVSEDTSPEDIGGFLAAVGIVTARGGRASHAAVVARGIDRAAVCSVAGLEVEAGGARFGGTAIATGETLSIDGASGEVFAGRLPLVYPPDHPDVERLLAACDKRRTVPVLAAAAEPWADGVFAAGDAVECSSLEQLEQAVAAGRERIVVVPGQAEEPARLLATAAAVAPAGVFVRVGSDWPAKVAGLPAGRWSGVVADEGAGRAARLLAATAPTLDP
jgi:phosphohistidine swiveling domain-containing protein